MDRRPISDHVRRWLLPELDAWRTGGILADDQSARILNLYETTEETARRKHSLALFALSGLASVMIGAAVLLAVSYNWQAMSAAVKLTIIFGTLLGAFVVAYWLRFHTQFQLASEIVFFLNGVFYGAAIWLIAQVFHIQSHYPDGVWFWALGVLPLALCLDTLLLHALYVALLAIWVGTEILGFQNINPWWFHGMHFPRIALTLPLMALPGLLWAYRKRSVVTVGLYVPLLAWWAVLQPIAWHGSWEMGTVFVVGLAGALLMMIAEMHREGNPIARPYRFWGILVTGGVLVPLSFTDFLCEYFRYGPKDGRVATGLLIGAVGIAVAILAVFIQRRQLAPSNRHDTSFATSVSRLWLPVLVTLMMMSLSLWMGWLEWGPYNYTSHQLLKWSPQVLVPVAAVNILMIVLALWLMRLGLREDRTDLFAAGVLYFLLWTILRYCDLFGGAGGMLGASLMFLLCGLGLFAIARFWQHRKEIGNV